MAVCGNVPVGTGCCANGLAYVFRVRFSGESSYVRMNRFHLLGFCRSQSNEKIRCQVRQGLVIDVTLASFNRVLLGPCNVLRSGSIICLAVACTASHCFVPGFLPPLPPVLWTEIYLFACVPTGRSQVMQSVVYMQVIDQIGGCSVV